MTDAYVALYVEPGDHHRLIGTFDSWASLTHHLSTQYPTWMQGGGLIPTGRTADGLLTGEPIQWTAGDDASHIEVARTTVHTSTEPDPEPSMAPHKVTHHIQIHLPEWGDAWNDVEHEEPGFDDDPPRGPIGTTLEAVTDSIARVRANRPGKTFRIVQRTETVLDT